MERAGQEGTAEEAAQRMNELFSNMEQTSERMLEYLKALKDLKQTDETKTASIGYCLGGALSLHLARMGADVTGVASFSWQFASAQAS